MIIFLYGEDGFRSSRKLAEIKNKFFEKNNPDSMSGLFDFSEKEYSVDDILMSFSSMGLFSSKKLIIIKNYFAVKKGTLDEKLEKFLKQDSLPAGRQGKNPNKDLILIFWEEGKVKKSEKGYKLLQKIAKCQEFELLEGAKLKNWIVSEIKSLSNDKVAISAQAVDQLVVFVGSDLNLLSRETEKLVSYKNLGEIVPSDVDLLVKSKIDTDIFQTVDALARGDKKTAMKLLHNHLEAGEDPFYLLSMYFYQFRNLVKVSPLAEKNMTPGDIAARLKMHPFVARKSLDQARNFSWPKLKVLYQKLCDIDFESKTGQTDIELALDKFVAEV
jgi:DNA polymerase III subunit delta